MVPWIIDFQWGMNDRIDLNNPGTSFDLYYHVIELDDITKTVGENTLSNRLILQLVSQ